MVADLRQNLTVPLCWRRGTTLTTPRRGSTRRRRALAHHGLDARSQHAFPGQLGAALLEAFRSEHRLTPVAPMKCRTTIGREATCSSPEGRTERHFDHVLVAATLPDAALPLRPRSGGPPP